MAVDGARLAIDIVPVFDGRGDRAPHPARRAHLLCRRRLVDGTAVELAKLAADDADVTVLELSRNFGHQAALTAGLDHAQGDVVVTLDGDGQHPPELIPQIVELHRAATTSCSRSG